MDVHSNQLLSLLLQIFGLLRIPMNRPSGGMPLFQMSDLMDKRYESLRYIFQLCYRVIQHSQKGYRKNQVNTTFPTHNKYLIPAYTHTQRIINLLPHTHTHLFFISNLP